MTPYKLFFDKPTLFECKLELDGADLNESTVRLIAENSKKSFVFKGNLDKKGNCSINIPKLRGFFENEDVGELTLEVIVEDSYFSPWKTPFVVETNKKLTVEVKETQPTQVKPVMKVTVKESVSQKPVAPIDRVIGELAKRRIDVSNILKAENKNTLYSLIETHIGPINKNPSIIQEIIKRIK